MDKKQIQVLLLEDEAAHAEAIRRALESSDGDLKLHIVGSLKGFRDYIAADTPDIALVDMVLPDGNGIDLLTYPPESKAFPMLILTSHGNEKAAVDALKAGALDYVVKSPETFAAMPRIITRNLTQWSLIQKNNKNEQALRESEQNFRNSLEGSLIGIYIADKDWQPTFANKAFLDLFDYANIDEVKVSPPHKRYTPESLADLKRRSETKLRGLPIPNQIEVAITKKDGTIRYLHIFLQEIFWDGKKQHQLFYNDITQRKQTEEQLKQSEEKFRLLTENSLFGVYINQDAKMVYVNTSFAKIFGYEPNEIAGNLSLKDLIHPDDIPSVMRRLQERLEGKKEERPIAYRGIKKDGSIFFIEVHGTSIDYQGKKAVMGTLEDITEREYAREELIKAREQYRTLIDNANEAIVVAQDGYLKFVNRTVLELFPGYSEKELMNTPFTDFIHADDRGRIIEKFRKRINNEPLSPRNEYRIIMKDGSIRWTDIGTALIDWNSKPASLNFITDITEHKRAEEMLRSEQIMLARTEGIAHIGSWAWDVASDTVTWSDELFRIFQWDPQEGAPSFAEQSAIYPPEDMARLQQAVEAAVANGTPYELELRAFRKDGETLSCLARGIAEMAMAGRAVRLFGSLQDITERKKGETALLASEERFRLIAESALVGVYIVQDGKFSYANPAMALIFGYSVDEFIGMTTHQIVQLTDQALVDKNIQRRIDGKVKALQYEIKGRYKDGSTRDVEIHGSRVDINGRPAIIGTLIDMTERKQAEKEKHKLEDKAQINSRLTAVGEMAAGIAHEINNPLTGVIGFSQLLLEKQNVPEDIKHDLTIIADGSRRVADIVKRLLTFARQTKPVKTMANLNELIENTLKLREYVLKTNNINVITKFDPELPLSLVDPGQLQQVFLNLIVNAEQEMKKAHGKGTLTITTEKKENNIRMSFQDDGPGITQENLGRLFEPFFTTKDVGEGTGLGLSLSRSIVLEHGGTLNVESEFGHGATFIVEIPIIESLPFGVATSTLATKMKPAAIKKGKILVVDDESGVRTLLERVLTQSGHSVDITDDASKALDKLSAGVSYDVILTDARMPGMSGKELYSKIIEKTPQMKNKIIFITGDVMGLDIKVFLAQNKLPYLAKPFDIELLKKQIDTIMNAG